MRPFSRSVTTVGRLALRPGPCTLSLWQRGTVARLISSSTLRHAQEDGSSSSDPLSFSEAHFNQSKARSVQRRRTMVEPEAHDPTWTSDGEAQGPPRPPVVDEMDSDLDPREHAVISVFDLFSIGIGPSSSHTVGVLRAGAIFATDLLQAGLLERVDRIRVVLYGSLAATGEGHMTAEALLMGFEGADCETVDTDAISKRVEEIKAKKTIRMGRDTEGANGGKEVKFDFAKDLDWQWQKKLPLHPNGLRFSVFTEEGDLLAVRDAYSIGGGFTINGDIQVGKEDNTAHPHPVDLTENAFYKETKRGDADAARRAGSRVSDPVEQAKLVALPPPVEDAEAVPATEPAKAVPTELLGGVTPSDEPPLPFHNAASLLDICRRNNMTIAQVVWTNERKWNSEEAIREKLFKIWSVMDQSILKGVTSTEELLPGILRVRRRAPGLYRRLTKGVYGGDRLLGGGVGVPASLGGTPKSSSQKSNPKELSTDGPISAFDAFRSHLPATNVSPPRVLGRFDHAVLPVPPRMPQSHSTDFLSAYALAVNEVNASGGRLVIAPTLGAAGVIPAMLKYWLEFSSEQPVRDVQTFLLTAGAIAMLFKRGSTISAADGGCMAEVGVATSMAAAGYAAVMGASPEVIENAAEIGIEASLGLTCDPVAGQVMVPCIERNAIGVHKALVSAQLALAGDGKHVVSLDDAIRAMRATAAGMSESFKETSLSGLATSVRVPVSMADC